MANTTTKTTKSTKSTADKATENAAKTVQAAEPAVEEKVVPKEIDLSQFITVKNGFHGRLIYVSRKTGEEFIWEDFGDEQEMELKELRNVKSSAKDFFINNWFMFEDEYAWVIDYLGVNRYYENAISIDGFDEIFSMSAEDIGKIVAKMSEGQKTSLAYKACRMINDGEIDSRKTITALEKALGVELIEH